MKRFVLTSLMSLSIVSLGCSGASPANVPYTGTSNNSISSNQSPTKAPGPSVAPSFDLIFQYALGEKNELNTFNGTYTREIPGGAPIIVNLTLNETELDSIYQKMVEIDFFGYPENFSVPPGGRMHVPAYSYYFKVRYDSKIKELRWNDNNDAPDTQAAKLRQLIFLITNVIESKEEIKKLPRGFPPP